MRGLRVTTRKCAGQTRMYTCLYPYMGIVSRDNVHNVKVTARVRRACIHSYIHIWALYQVTMYTMLRLLRRSDAHRIYIHIWVSCHHTMYPMLRLLRGSDAHTHILMSIYGYCILSDNVHNIRVTARVIYSTYIRQKISYPYMGTV